MTIILYYRLHPSSEPFAVVSAESAWVCIDMASHFHHSLYRWKVRP